jgi:hypothetical protein
MDVFFQPQLHCGQSNKKGGEDEAPRFPGCL